MNGVYRSTSQRIPTTSNTQKASKGNTRDYGPHAQPSYSFTIIRTRIIPRLAHTASSPRLVQLTAIYSLCYVVDIPQPLGSFSDGTGRQLCPPDGYNRPLMCRPRATPRTNSGRVSLKGPDPAGHSSKEPQSTSAPANILLLARANLFWRQRAALCLRASATRAPTSNDFPRIRTSPSSCAAHLIPLTTKSHT